MQQATQVKNVCSVVKICKDLSEIIANKFAIVKTKETRVILTLEFAMVTQFVQLVGKD